MKRHHHDKNAALAPFLHVLVLLCTGWYLAGCASLTEHVVAPTRTYLPEETARALLASGNQGMIFTAEADVTVDGPHGKYMRTVALTAAEPSSLRVEGIPLFGLPDFYLVAKDDTIRVFSPGQGKYYIAAAGETSLSRFLDINLSVEEAVRLLMGSAPPFPEETRHEAYCEGDRCRIEVYSGTRRVAVIGMRAGGDIDTIEASTGEGIPWYSAVFDDYGQEENPLCPRHISLRIEKPEKTSIEIRYRNAEFRPAEDAGSLFELPVPPGVTVELLAD